MNDSDTRRRSDVDGRGNASDAGLLVHVVSNDARTLQDELEQAIRTVRDGAQPGNRSGILITRHSEALFTVTHSPDVPYGTTIEQDRWHRHS